MNHELAKTLTTALVQFIDREQPKDKMGVSSIEAEELERCFTEEKFNRVEDWYAHRMKPELTEFEQALSNYLKNDFEYFHTKKWDEQKWNDVIRTQSKELLALAKKELLSYADESNPAIEAMADLERTFECNPDKLPGWLKDELAKKHLDGYCMGREDTLREMKDFVESHFTHKKYKSPECGTTAGTQIVIPDNWPPKMPDLPTQTTTTGGKY